MAQVDDKLSKEDLYLLLESYKNSVEMNTVISQQLASIQDILKRIKNDTIESDLKEKITATLDSTEKIKEKIDSHNTKSLLAIGKVTSKVTILYFAIGSIVLSLITLIIVIIEKFDQIKHIANHLGVG